MIYSGIDIVEVKRIEKLIKKDSFLRKIFSKNEILYLESRKYKPTTAAGIFSAKEAVSKCLGTGIAGFGWSEIEILKDELGKPYVKLTGKAKTLSEKKSIKNIEISITHIEKYAVAIAVAEILEMELKKDTYIRSEFRIPPRELNTHKGNYGRIGIIGGKTGMSGSVYFSAMAAIKSGAGLVYAVCPDSIRDILSFKLNEVIIEKISEQGEYLKETDLGEILEKISKYDVLCIGPGIGTDESTRALIRKLLLFSDKTVVLDADGLNCICDQLGILKRRKGNTVITPHVGEMSRLTGLSVEDINNNRIEIAKDFSMEYNVITVLKGNETVVAYGTEVYVNRTGNPGMATAGSGDVLTGIIGSFIGQGFDINYASKMGVFIHGLAGDMALDKYGEYGMIASDILEMLPYAIKNANKKE
jgi:NAD(P)H-hydrate epimerase